MQNLSDFVAMGKEFGLVKDELRQFAESEYGKYLQIIDQETKKKA